jgi:hypothetical protein
MARFRRALSTEVLAWTFLSFAVLSGTVLASAQSRYRIAGTYTNITYIEEADDVVGYELKIVPAKENKYEGALQIAEGVPSDVMVVDVQAKGNKITFVIPPKYKPFDGQFSGAVEKDVLKGEFRFNSGASDKVALKRGKSYWD